MGILLLELPFFYPSGKKLFKPRQLKKVIIVNSRCLVPSRWQFKSTVKKSEQLLNEHHMRRQLALGAGNTS